jgi:hypothetical protein
MYTVYVFQYNFLLKNARYVSNQFMVSLIQIVLKNINSAHLSE